MTFLTRISMLCCLFLALGLAAYGQLGSLEVRGATATQFVVAYTAPDERSCSVEVSESAEFFPPVHDVNPDLFADSNIDLLRDSSIANGLERVLVIGKRAAEEAGDRRRYSRALQTNTDHHLRISCQDGSQQVTLIRTSNIPLGMTYGVPLPADPKRAGEYAWPTIDWDNRSQTIVDPQTGVLLKRVTAPLDRFDRYEGAFGRVVDFDGAWRNPSAILADDGVSSVFRGPGKNWLFLSSNTGFYLAGNHDATPGSLDQYRVRLNAWCSSSGCGSALPENRSLEACLTVNGVSCATPLQDILLEFCNGACRESRYLPVAGGGDRAMLGNWTESLQFDITDAHMRGGAVDRDGALVIQKAGSPFGLHWTQGSWISIGGVMRRIAKVINQNQLLLEGSPEGSETDAAYLAPNFGVLIRKKTESSEELVIQSARFEAVVGNGFLWDAGGDGDSAAQCSPVQVEGPKGEMGWNCNFGELLYWIGANSGNVSVIGNAVLPLRSGADGWSRGFCASVTWDRRRPGVFYCLLPGNQGGEAVIRGTYSGANETGGPRYLYQTIPECPSSALDGCFHLENVTPFSRGLSLRQQLAQFYPEWRNFKSPYIQFAGTLGLRNAIQIFARRDLASNDTTAILGIFDLETHRVSAAVTSWKSAPLRWTAFHGTRSLPDSDWISLPATGFRGPFTGKDWLAGNGPYASKIVSGPVSASGEPCPVRPANAPIPSNEWPTGNRCVTVTVDGEPADPTPLLVEGRFTTEGQNVRVSGTTVRSLANGSQVKIGEDWYSYQYIDDTHGRLTPQPAEVLQNTPFVLYEEPVNNPKTGNPLHAYLQDAQVGDIFCGTRTPVNHGSQINGCNSFTSIMEFFRLVAKDGKRWTLQRGYFGPAPAETFHPLPADSTLVAAPASCVFLKPYSCANAGVMWNVTADPMGLNVNGGMLVDSMDQGAGHTVMGPSFSASAVSNICPRIEGDLYSCYNIRSAGSFKDLLSAENQVSSLNPRFAGLLGLGSPNDVDSHPSFTQLLAPAEEKVWFTDARPQFGDRINSGAVAANVDGYLWKFPANAHQRLRPKILPTYAYCGVNPLVDISGPLARITGTAEDSYKYCLALQSGECAEDSAAGELFVNCPYLSRPSCVYPGIAVTNSDQRDLCIGDLSAYAGGITQVAHDRTDLTGRYGRLLTKGLSRYRYLDVFWNVKTTPDGKWGMFRTAWLDGKRTEVMMAKLPPFPADDGLDRASFIPVRLEVPPEGSARVSGAVIEFGYDKDFRCTTRNDACVKGSEPGNDYSFASQPLKPKDCAGGCLIEMPVLPQRVYYFRVRYVDPDGNTVSRTATAAWTTP